MLGSLFVLLLVSCAPEPGSSGPPGTGGKIGSGGVTGTGGSLAGSGGQLGSGSGGSSPAGSGGAVATGGAGTGGEAGAGSGGATAAGGNTAAAGATGRGGEAGAGSAGAKGGHAGTGSGGMSASGGRGAGGSAAGGGAGPFACNQVTGGKLTEEWFIAGFEKVVDNARWQVKWREDGYVEEWANPQSAFWNAPVDSACSGGSTTSPDRVVFGAVTWKYKTQAEFRSAITQAVNTFKSKYPNLRRIDLVTQIRGPNNMNCPTPPTPGEPIAVPAIQDAAMDEVAAAFPGFVFVGPKVQAQACADFVGGGPHLTAAGNAANVGAFSAYFSAAQ